MPAKGYIFDIKKFSINDGPGIRTTVFFKGCPLNCLWCHNPESRSKLPEKITENDYNWSIYSISCSPDTIGKQVSSDEVMLEILKDKIFYEESGGGVTFSGGEPMMQTEFLYSLLKASKECGLNTAVDTSGYTQFSNLEKIYELTDFFLYDLKILDSELHEKYTGFSNTIILENLINLVNLGDKVVIRIPLVPGVNDDEKSISDLVRFLKDLKVKNIHLLPFHNSAVSKYKRLGLEYPMETLIPSGAKDIEYYKKRFSETGKSVITGG